MGGGAHLCVRVLLLCYCGEADLYTTDCVLYQEPMRAEGPKERPTAVLCVQLSARYVQIRHTAKFEILRPSGYYITTF